MQSVTNDKHKLKININAIKNLFLIKICLIKHFNWFLIKTSLSAIAATLDASLHVTTSVWFFIAIATR